MSAVAEFARNLHENKSKPPARFLTPLTYAAKVERLFDIKAAIFDVYGTLANYWRPEFETSESKERALLEAFARTAERFAMTGILAELNPKEPPEQTLRDFYHGLIGLNHGKSIKKGVRFPEVKIEEIWFVIIMMLRRHGYDPMRLELGQDQELARCMAFHYNFYSLGRGFFSGVADALAALKKNNIKLGIISNAQFYTPVDLTLFLRDQSENRFDDYLELFDPDLIFYSYEYGVAKPNELMFRKLFEAFYEMHILPSQAVFIGNDLSVDIQPAQSAGMLTALFCGDDRVAYLHDLAYKIIPDITFERYQELPLRLSFYEEKPSEGMTR